ncbi:4-alpha-glucanotransferase [Gleimia hominis]|uniref:4-alpha-glucanotransferase n=1 Tax=Gleimia hominis TaxID=595468 RepID=UPI002543C90D|nr:4-alpha-glucanotransferase [Gleimia hominis]WIK64869.1 4-alpha-glucanotransferase [Gleimia hominis]
MTHLPPPDLFPENLSELANRLGVSTKFWSWHGQLKDVHPLSLVKVLQSLGENLPDMPSSQDIDALLTAHEQDEWRHTLPVCTVKRQGDWQELRVHVPDGSAVTVEVELEDGTVHPVPQIENWEPPREVDGVLTGRAGFALEQWLPLGYHTLRAHREDGQVINAHLIAVPPSLQSELFEDNARYWGLSSQLYSIRAKQSWGMGDTAVLTELSEHFAQKGADFHLINPLHSGAPVLPIEPSPYLPTSRRFNDPIYIHPQSIPEYDSLSPMEKLDVEQHHRASLVDDSDSVGLINRDQVWSTKDAALRVIYRHPLSSERQQQFDAFIAAGGTPLRNFALWCALVSEFGGIELPEKYHSANTAVSQQYAREHEPQIRYFMWLQWVLNEQLTNAQTRMRRAGMRIGLMADLAVGVHPLGADVWADPAVYASGMTVGAPPDMYSQQGQDWSQPPWNPRVLAKRGYAPLRDMIRATLSHGGAVRIDHILGLFRLWWIPTGMDAHHGTYVQYDHEAMVGVLLLEAQRAGAVIIGEDLGTVEPWVRGYLNERGIFGTSILWFEKEDDDTPLHADHYRERALVAVNTHDLPPTAGYLRGVQTDLRHELGLLVEPLEHVRAHDDEERLAMVNRLVEYGLLSEEERGNETAVINALYAYITRTPAHLLAVSTVDIVADTQPQNLPGTHRQYPNWCVPLADAKGREVTLERLLAWPVDDLCSLMNRGVSR